MMFQAKILSNTTKTIVDVGFPSDSYSPNYAPDKSRISQRVVVVKCHGELDTSWGCTFEHDKNDCASHFPITVLLQVLCSS